MKRLKLFFWCILFQVFILNYINLNEFLNPYYYVIFILTIPYKTNRSLILLISFITGLIIDSFSNTYGAHTFACVSISYLNILWNKQSYHLPEEDKLEMLNLPIREFLFKASIMVMTHHFILFFISNFSWQEIWLTIQLTISTTFFTLILLIVHKLLAEKKL